MARRIGLGHHSAWRETDHPRDDDGKFAPSPGHGHHHTTPNTAAAAPAPTRGMPNILTGADIRTRAGQDLALDRNLDGSLTLANGNTSVHLSKSAGNDLRHAIDKLQDDGIEPGRESWISTIDTSGQPRNVVMAAKEKGGRLSLRIAPRPDATIDDIRSSQPIILGKTDLGKIDDAFLRMDARCSLVSPRCSRLAAWVFWRLAF